ncbi:hypothetical protein ET428_20885, partial [Salmonella enterica]|nr:hypothetical protein [Salmonella enterica]
HLMNIHSSAFSFFKITFRFFLTGIKYLCGKNIFTYSCSLGFRRWRRLISPSIAEMINCDVLSPGSFTFSIPSTVSCGTRARSACDFAFTLPVGISESPVIWCRPSYTKKSYIQSLTCRPPRAILFLSGLHQWKGNTAYRPLKQQNPAVVEH